jgi:hypothetical protein
MELHNEFPDLGTQQIWIKEIPKPTDTGKYMVPGERRIWQLRPHRVSRYTRSPVRKPGTLRGISATTLLLKLDAPWRFWATPSIADEFAHDGKTPNSHDPQVEAIQLLMGLNRQIYYECPVVSTLTERVRAFFHFTLPTGQQ